MQILSALEEKHLSSMIQLKSFQEQSGKKCLPNLLKSLFFVVSAKHIWLTFGGKTTVLPSPVALLNKYHFNPSNAQR